MGKVLPCFISTKMRPAKMIFIYQVLFDGKKRKAPRLRQHELHSTIVKRVALVLAIIRCFY